jgi:hypothetical protein
MAGPSSAPMPSSRSYSRLRLKMAVSSMGWRREERDVLAQGVDLGLVLGHDRWLEDLDKVPGLNENTSSAPPLVLARRFEEARSIGFRQDVVDVHQHAFRGRRVDRPSLRDGSAHHLDPQRAVRRGESLPRVLEVAIHAVVRGRNPIA